MQFPLDPRVEAAFGALGGDTSTWTWTDVTGDLLGGVSIDITHGRQDEQSAVQPSDATLVLRDPQGDYMPGNALGAHYPHIVQGTPLRVRLAGVDADRYLRLPGMLGSYALTPADSSLDVGRNFDVRMDVGLDTWRPDRWRMIAALSDPDNDVFAWALYVTEDGYPQITFSRDGTHGTTWYYRFSVPIPREAERYAFRVVVAENGDGTYDVTLLDAATIDGPWTEQRVFPDNSNAAPASGAPLRIGSAHHDQSLWRRGMSGRVYAVELRDGSGTLVAAADVRDRDSGTRAFTDTAGRPWTLHGHADVLDPTLRFNGDVAELAPQWPHGDHVTDTDPVEMTVDVTAAGLLRRLGQGTSALQSTLRRALSQEGRAVAYWPLEDGKDTTQFASGIGGAPLLPTFSAGLTSDIDPAVYDEFAAADAVPEWHATGASGPIERAADTGELRIFGLIHVPEGGIPGEARVFSVRTTGTAAEWALYLRYDGALQIRVYDRDGAEIGGFTWWFFDLGGGHTLNGIWLRQTGSDIDARVFTYELEELPGERDYTVGSHTLSGHTLGAPTALTIGGDGDLAGTAISHVPVLTTDTAVMGDELLDASVAYTGELAADRIVRLCTEEGIRATTIGENTRSESCGPQEIDTLLGLLQAAADADGGILSEMRSLPGLIYRSRHAMYNPPTRLTLDAARDGIGDIVNPFQPVLDDQAVRNDVTVKRPGGSSARVRDEDDIARRGRYDEQVTLNVEADGRLAALAGWLLHLGTWPGMRYPTVSPALNGMPDLIAPWLEVDIGERVDVTRLPAQHPTDTVAELVQGYTESWLPTRVDVQANTTPADPWRAAIADVHRATTVHSEVAADVQAGTDTTFDLVSGSVEGFEDPDLLLDLVDGGDAPWVRDDSTANSGTWSLRSGTIGDGQTSDASVTVPAWAHWLQLAVRTSSEWGWDWLHILLDDEVIYERDGDQAWTTTDRLPVTPGSTVTFRYTKDGATSSFQDAVWIDDVTWVADAGWTTDAAQFPLEVVASGVRLRVTGITGDGPVQTATVEPTPVNDVVKTIPRGASVQLADPAVLAP